MIQLSIRVSFEKRNAIESGRGLAFSIRTAKKGVGAIGGSCYTDSAMNEPFLFFHATCNMCTKDTLGLSEWERAWEWE